ncbi:MAG: hypothetical protein CMO01_04620 [Thalassobius sp.]|nr:hypothetical protein [Thalassovita sp.]
MIILKNWTLIFSIVILLSIENIKKPEIIHFSISECITSSVKKSKIGLQDLRITNDTLVLNLGVCGACSNDYFTTLISSDNSLDIRMETMDITMCSCFYNVEIQIKNFNKSSINAITFNGLKIEELKKEEYCVLDEINIESDSISDYINSLKEY